MRRLAGGVLLIALSTLVLELMLTRVFDVTLTPNLSYCVVSLAIFSFGLAGVYATLRPVPVERDIRGRVHARAYGLTVVYVYGYIRGMESTFAIIAEPSRRAILRLLASSERSVGDIEEKLNLAQPSVSKHLRVLREAGFVESRVDAQRRLYRIKPEPLMEIDAWLAPFRRFWSVHIDALQRHLDQMNPVPRRKGKKR